MQSLFTFLTQLLSKGWVIVVVTVVSGAASAVIYFSPSSGSPSGASGKPVQVVQIGPVTLPNANVPLPGADAPPPVVPEANAGVVLIPVLAAVLLFSSRRLWPARPCAAPIEKKTIVEP